MGSFLSGISPALCVVCAMGAIVWTSTSGEAGYTSAVDNTTGMEYLLSTDTLMPFDAARNACQQLSGDLAVINTPQLSDWIVSNVLKSVCGIWIGLKNFADACGPKCRDKWRWVDGTSTSAWKNWVNNDEPHNSERCVRIENCSYWAGIRCRTNRPYHICERDYNECQDEPCYNNATCNNTQGSFTCDCQTGWYGATCQEDYNECQDEPCYNNATCNNTQGSFTCDCQTGWYGATCQEDIDECSETSDMCNMNGNCTNLPGSYSCICSEGWTGNSCQSEIQYPDDHGQPPDESTSNGTTTALRATIGVAGSIVLLLLVTISIFCILNKRLEEKLCKSKSAPELIEDSSRPGTFPVYENYAQSQTSQN